MMRLLLTAFFFEAGLVLLIIPWSVYWEQNYFVQALPAVQAFLANDFVRGAVSGLGVVNLTSGIVELISILLARHSEAAPLTLRGHEQIEK